MMSMLCNCYVRELLILARTWFAFGLPSKTGCDSRHFGGGKRATRCPGPLAGEHDEACEGGKEGWDPSEVCTARI
jgi:hypothetical protein